MPKKRDKNSEFAITLRERLTDLRKEKLKLTQTEFAKYVGISTSSVGLYETGERIPDAETLYKISSKCNISTDYLLGISEYKNTEKLKPCIFCGGEAMSRSEALKLIYNIIKEKYGGCVRVNITVNSGGVSCEATEKPFTIGSSMRTINGDFLPQKETEE